MLVHVAVPRTASSSVKRLLKLSYSGRLAGAAGSTADAATSMLLTESQRKRRGARIAAVSGHYPIGVRSPYSRDATIYVTTSREPVARVVGSWRWSWLTHRLPFGEWLDTASYWAHNAITRHLAGGPVAYPPLGALLSAVEPVTLPDVTEAHALRAAANLRACALVGVVERFRSFQRELETLIGLPPQPVVHERWIDGKRDVASSTEVLDSLSPAMRRAILALNEHDAALHEVAREIAA